MFETFIIFLNVGWEKEKMEEGSKNVDKAWNSHCLEPPLSNPDNLTMWSSEVII